MSKPVASKVIMVTKEVTQSCQCSLFKIKFTFMDIVRVGGDGRFFPARQHNID